MFFILVCHQEVWEDNFTVQKSELNHVYMIDKDFQNVKSMPIADADADRNRFNGILAESESRQGRTLWGPS